ncbi:MAG: hypothetical protein CMO81_02815 [Waddliaceae bacterium]|nr:hypothetical protein [Waddliaceae bacterium]
MGLSGRLQLAMQSDLAFMVYLIVFALSILGVIYAFLRWKQFKRDAFAYYFRTYFAKIENLSLPFSFVGAHSANFFGRETIVKQENGSYGLCTVLRPGLINEHSVNNLQLCQRVLQHCDQVVLARQSSWVQSDIALVMEEGMVRDDGRRLMSFREYCFDDTLQLSDRENLLLQLARALAVLHSLNVDVKRPFYHGFLLPRSIFLDVDGQKNLRKLVLGYSGFAYSIGAKNVYALLEELASGNLMLDRNVSREMLEQQSGLAPEQRRKEGLSVVGQESDYYSYGVLAVLLFTQEPFYNLDQVNWDRIPDNWRSFVKSCLFADPSLRPKDFLELEDRVLDPEISLTIAEAERQLDERESSDEGGSLLALEELPGLLGKVREALKDGSVNRLPEQKTDQKLFQKRLQSGYSAIKTSKWSLAQERFLQALNLAPNHPEANVGVAIALYELGDLKQAEKHYQMAREENPAVAARFREHTAFRV